MKRGIFAACLIASLSALPLLAEAASQAGPPGLPGAAGSQIDAQAPSRSPDEIAMGYQRNFVRSSLSIKLDLLKEAAGIDKADMSPLYRMAVDFCIDNAMLLQNDVQLRDIAAYSTIRLAKLGDEDSANRLWSLFQVFKEPAVRVPVMNALSGLAAGNAQLILNMNSFLYNQNTVRQAGVEPDYQTIEACVAALGNLGSATSFPVLFAVYSSGYPSNIVRKAQDALASLQGDYKGYLTEVIRKNPPMDKASALRAAIDNPRFSEADKAEVAEASLDTALSFQSAVQSEANLNRETRYRAVRELGQRSWSKATPLVVRNFSVALDEYSRKEGSKQALLEAIACLGSMKTTEAAQTLTLHLQLLNAEADSGKAPDEQLTLAVIDNLGKLGDKTAFDHLLFVSYLPYPETIKAAARDALKKLKLQ